VEIILARPWHHGATNPTTKYDLAPFGARAGSLKHR
jgi:hypothetical protein